MNDPTPTGLENAAESMGSKIREAADSFQESAKQAATETKQRVMRSGQAVRHYLDDRRQPTADALDRTAGKLESAANYIRTSDTEAMMRDTRQFMQRHPVPFVIAAISVGFLIGRAFYPSRERS